MRSSNLLDDIVNIPGAVGDVINFWSDPWGNLYKAGREAVVSLSTDLIPAITESTLPNLTLPGFVRTYAVSFALAMLVAVLLLIVQLVRTARGRQSGEELLETIGLYFPTFLVGMMFGPAIGLLVVEFVRALSRSLNEWAYAGTVDEMVDTLQRIIVEDPALLPGGVYLAILIVWAMALGLLLLVVFFIVQLVTLYFLGVLFPLASVWFIDPQRRGALLTAAGAWIGMLMVHPLLFLMLGFSFRIAIDGIGTWGDDGWRNFVTLVVAACAIFMAELAPFFLVKAIRRGLAQPPAGGDRPAALPIGPKAPGQASSGGGARTVTAARGGQAVRVSASPGAARGAVATRSGARMGAAAPAAARGGAAAASRAGAARAGAGAARAGAGAAAKAAGPVAAAASTAVQGSAAASRRMRADADTSITPPPPEAHGKERPQ